MPENAWISRKGACNGLYRPEGTCGSAYM